MPDTGSDTGLAIISSAKVGLEARTDLRSQIEILDGRSNSNRRWAEDLGTPRLEEEIRAAARRPVQNVEPGKEDRLRIRQRQERILAPDEHANSSNRSDWGSSRRHCTQH
jgi:hypothetical protein